MKRLRHQSERIGLWWLWTVSCGAGELIGLAIAAGLAATMNQIVGEPQSLQQRLTVLSVMVVAGVLEGTAIGCFQWRVLRHVFRNLSASAWLIPTISVAAIGWLIGMLQPTFFADAESAAPGVARATGSSLASMLLFAAAFGVFAGAVFGFAQWLPLREHADRAWIWIPANAIGWAVAMAIIFVGATLPEANWLIWQIIPLGAIVGIVAGLAVGAITGIGLVQIVSVKHYKTVGGEQNGAGTKP